MRSSLLVFVGGLVASGTALIFPKVNVSNKILRRQGTDTCASGWNAVETDTIIPCTKEADNLACLCTQPVADKIQKAIDVCYAHKDANTIIVSRLEEFVTDYEQHCAGAGEQVPTLTIGPNAGTESPSVSIVATPTPSTSPTPSSIVTPATTTPLASSAAPSPSPSATTSTTSGDRQIQITGAVFFASLLAITVLL